MLRQIAQARTYTKFIVHEKEKKYKINEMKRIDEAALKQMLLEFRIALLKTMIN